MSRVAYKLRKNPKAIGVREEEGQEEKEKEEEVKEKSWKQFDVVDNPIIRRTLTDSY